MRQGSNSGRRPRGRTNRKQHGGGGGGQSGTRTFDSNGPEGRVRGNARQVYEKYLSLARDASSAGDRIAAEAYYQYAEHYFRILSDSTDPTPSGRRPEERPPQPYGQDEGYYGDDDDDDGPVNGQGGERQHEARNNGNAAPQAQREPGQRGSGQRDSGPRDSGRRDSGQRDSGQRDSARRDPAPRDAAPREGARAPVEAAAPAVASGAQPQPEVQAQPTAADGEAPRPRRGRPRKPRPDDDGQAVQQDSSSKTETETETESGPAVG
jgi:hypothetical protein